MITPTDAQHHISRRQDHALWSWIAARLNTRKLEGEPSAISHDPTMFKPLSRSQIWRASQAELGGLIWELTPHATRAQLSGSAHLHRLWLRQGASHLARSAALSMHWPQDLPPPLLIKGSDLELSLYPRRALSAGARASSDWDVILPDPHYTSLVKTWTRRFGAPIQPQSARFIDEEPHEVGFLINGALIEVHRDPAPRFFSPLSGEDLWRRGRRAFTPEGLEVKHPQPTDRLLIWLVNYAKAGGAVRSQSWLDLTLILEDVGTSHHREEAAIEIEILEAEAAQYGLKNALRAALTMWTRSPLSQLNVQLSAEITERVDSGNWPQEPRSAQRSDPLRVALNQVRYCAPQVRSAYLNRAMYALFAGRGRDLPRSRASHR